MYYIILNSYPIFYKENWNKYNRKEKSDVIKLTKDQNDDCQYNDKLVKQIYIHIFLKPYRHVKNEWNYVGIIVVRFGWFSLSVPLIWIWMFFCLEKNKDVLNNNLKHVSNNFHSRFSGIGIYVFFYFNNDGVSIEVSPSLL